MKKKLHLLLLFFVALSFVCTGVADAAPKTPPLPLQCVAPQWLQQSIRGSMNAVWRELQSARLSRRAAVEALALVGSRLFPGYHVSISPRGLVVMRPEQAWRWTSVIVFPENGDRLPAPCVNWLKRDIETATGGLRELVDSVPPEALRWSSDSFQSALKALIARTIPGWSCSARVQASGQNAELEVKIYPQTPLLLAVAPETLSGTIPQLLADSINDDTLKYLSPLTGLPLDWISAHKDEVRAWLSERQLESPWLRALRASVDSEIILRPVTRVTTRIESTTFSLRGWLSGHAGSDARLEAGIHFGHYFSLDRIPMEAYSELIVKLEDWRADGRLGLRLSPLKSVYLGIEGSTEDSAHLWYRFWFDAADRKAYGWFRYSDGNDWEVAFGYRLNRYISLELHYDDREDDRFSVRALSNL